MGPIVNLKGPSPASDSRQHWHHRLGGRAHHITRKASWRMNRGPTFSEFPPQAGGHSPKRGKAGRTTRSTVAGIDRHSADVRFQYAGQGYGQASSAQGLRNSKNCCPPTPCRTSEDVVLSTPIRKGLRAIFSESPGAEVLRLGNFDSRSLR